MGLTEAEAVEKYGAANIKCYTSTFTNLWYGPWRMEPDMKPKTSTYPWNILKQQTLDI